MDYKVLDLRIVIDAETADWLRSVMQMEWATKGERSQEVLDAIENAEPIRAVPEA